jgi:two-component system sensor histidine kinase DctS
MQAMSDAPASSSSRRELTLLVKPAASNAASSWLVFEVADLGPGISPAVAAQLFTPFFTTKEEGMGLGLSLCRTVIEQHGGYLGHQANQPCGTIFSFTLPTQMA